MLSKVPFDIFCVLVVLILTVVTVCSDLAWRESASLREVVVDISADVERLLLFQVHVNLMMTEARMQAELLYALRAVNRYMT